MWTKAYVENKIQTNIIKVQKPVSAWPLWVIKVTEVSSVLSINKVYPGGTICVWVHLASPL